MQLLRVILYHLEKDCSGVQEITVEDNPQEIIRERLTDQ